MGYTVHTSYPSPPSSTTGPLIDISFHNNLHDVELNDSSAKPPLAPLSARFKHLICKIIFNIIHTIALPGAVAFKHLRPRFPHKPSIIDDDGKDTSHLSATGQEQFVYMICKECRCKKRQQGHMSDEKIVGDPVRYFYEDEKGSSSTVEDHSQGLMAAVDIESSATLSLASTVGGRYSAAPQQQSNGSSPTIGAALTWGRYPLTKERNAHRSVVG